MGGKNPPSLPSGLPQQQAGDVSCGSAPARRGATSSGGAFRGRHGGRRGRDARAGDEGEEEEGEEEEEEEEGQEEGSGLVPALLGGPFGAGDFI